MAKKAIKETNYDWRGPMVGIGMYLVREGDVYDLHDYFSAPRSVCGVLIRSPVEAAVNALAFVAMLSLGDFGGDPVVTTLKLLHLLLHVFIHCVSPVDDSGVIQFVVCRAVCGITFGLSRYAVLLSYLYRIDVRYLLVFGVLFLVSSKLRTLGEIMKTLSAMLVIFHYMAQRSELLLRARIVALSVALQTWGSVGHYIICQLRGGLYKPWKRSADRTWVAWHTIADSGNALFMIAAQVP